MHSLNFYLDIRDCYDDVSTLFMTLLQLQVSINSEVYETQEEALSPYYMHTLMSVAELNPCYLSHLQKVYQSIFV